MRGLLAAAVSLALSAGAATAGCNDAAAACEIAEGTYHIVLPKDATGPVPAIILLHGFTGQGADVIRFRPVIDVALAQGYAVIAPDGLPRPNGPGRTWGFHPDRPARRDEAAFIMAVADDATRQFGLRRDRMLLAGFSIGGSMVSYLACAHPDAFAAYAPVAGSFWRPHPTGCAGPVQLLHTHGLADRTVPLEGREVAPGFRQGNVYDAMGIWQATDGCKAKARQDRISIFTVQHWTDCTADAQIVFALHDGGHSIPEGWADMALDWFERR
jgi:polyhydroxybutyrate depolymerase